MDAIEAPSSRGEVLDIEAFALDGRRCVEIDREFVRHVDRDVVLGDVLDVHKRYGQLLMATGHYEESLRELLSRTSTLAESLKRRHAPTSDRPATVSSTRELQDQAA